MADRIRSTHGTRRVRGLWIDAQDNPLGAGSTNLLDPVPREGVEVVAQARAAVFERPCTLDQMTTATTTGQTIITLCNYDKHQRGSFTAATTATTTPTTTQTTTNKKELKQLERKNAHQGFDEWWAIYPRKKSRADAERAFTKVVPSLIALPALMEKTKAFAASCESKPEAERKFIPYPASWLNAGSYDDEPEGGAKPAPVVRDPRSYTDADWQKRLDHLRDCETWFEDRWGPRPGEPGCLVP